MLLTDLCNRRKTRAPANRSTLGVGGGRRRLPASAIGVDPTCRRLIPLQSPAVIRPPIEHALDGAGSASAAARQRRSEERRRAPMWSHPGPGVVGRARDSRDEPLTLHVASNSGAGRKIARARTRCQAGFSLRSRQGPQLRPTETSSIDKCPPRLFGDAAARHRSRGFAPAIRRPDALSPLGRYARRARLDRCPSGLPAGERRAMRRLSTSAIDPDHEHNHGPTELRRTSSTDARRCSNLEARPLGRTHRTADGGASAGAASRDVMGQGPRAG